MARPPSIEILDSVVNETGNHLGEVATFEGLIVA